MSKKGIVQSRASKSFSSHSVGFIGDVSILFARKVAWMALKNFAPTPKSAEIFKIKTKISLKISRSTATALNLNQTRKKFKFKYLQKTIFLIIAKNLSVR